MPIDTFRDRLARINEQIAATTARCGRSPESIRLVAVTKTHSVETILHAIDAGLVDLGENRVQEALPKLAALAGRPVRWHLIGHLQSNKVKQVVGRFAWLHGIDQVRLAQEVGRRSVERGIVQPVLLEVNVSGETTKYGFSPQELLENAGVLAEIPGIRIDGLMTMAPNVEDAERVRPVFAQLRELAVRLHSLRLPGLRMQELSMGMSNDYPVAIEEGATMIRLGTALFGPTG